MQNQNHWHELHKDARHQPRYPNDELVAFVFRNFKRGGKVLDLGCGAGRHAKFLAENGFEAYGCDYSENGIKACEALFERSGLKGDLRVASAAKLPYADEFFDGVLCFGALYYNDKDTIEAAAGEIYRVLKAGTRAYIVVRSLEDYRYEKARKITKYQVIVQENDENKAAFKENGMPMYFFDEAEVRRIFGRFARVEVNRIRVSFENDSYANDDFVVVCEK